MNLERSGLFSQVRFNSPPFLLPFLSLTHNRIFTIQIPSKYSSSLTKNWMNPTPTSLSSYFTQRELSLSPTSSSRNKRLLGDMMIPNSSGVEVSQFTSKVYSGQYSNDGTFFYTASNGKKQRVSKPPISSNTSTTDYIAYEDAIMSPTSSHSLESDGDDSDYAETGSHSKPSTSLPKRSKRSRPISTQPSRRNSNSSSQSTTTSTLPPRASSSKPRPDSPPPPRNPLYLLDSKSSINSIRKTFKSYPIRTTS